ncbi:MAG: PAS domain-containing protein [Alphaproteobacteria bacterium]|nr:PAS domain-containing protein [Alphaproteobacteria bacterium]
MDTTAMWETLLSEVSPVRREDEIASPHGRRFFRYWQDLCGEGEIPPRHAFDPVDVPWILGDLTLIEVMPGDYLFRVDGTRAVEFFANEMTGKLLSQYPFAERVGHMRMTYDTIVAGRGPHVWFRDARIRGKRWRFEQLIVPFSDDGESVTHLAVTLDTSPDLFARA